MVRPHAFSPIVLIVACYSPNVPVTSGAGSDDSGAGSTGEGGTSGALGAMGSDTADASSGLGSETSPESSSGPAVAVCGDGQVEGDEICDDGINDGAYGGCAPDCTGLGPHCGDDVAQAVEDCDDGNSTNGDGCNNDCVESGTTLWTRTHDGDAHENDHANGCAVAPNGDVIVVGEQGLDADATESWIRRYTADGDVVWTQSFIVGGNSTAYGVGVDDVGATYACGGHQIGQTWTIWARKFDIEGAGVWTHTYDGLPSGMDQCRDVAVDEDGDAVLAGMYATPSDSLDIWIRRLDGDDGDEFWTRTFDHEGGPDDARGAAYTADGFIYVGGKQGIANGSQTWLRKYDANGSVQWTRNGGIGGWGAIEGVAADAAGNVFVAGRETGTPQEVSTIWLAKYDANGELQWSVDEDFGTLDSGFGAACDSDGNVALVATAADGMYAAWVAKYDGDGTMLWSQFPHAGIDEVTGSFAFGVDIDSDDNVVVVGAEERPNAGQADVWVQKFAP